MQGILRSATAPNMRERLWSHQLRIVIVLHCALFLAACGAGSSAPDLQRLYGDATIDQHERRPVIVVPGLMGSRLMDKDTGDLVWGGTEFSADPSTPEGARALALPIGHGGEPLDRLFDNVHPDGLLGTASPSAMGVALEFDVYRGLVKTMITGGFDFRETREAELARQFNAGSFEFPYDWRRDIVEAARGLDDFIKRKREQVREVRAREFGVEVGEIKFDIVAHSMGTQVVRYYLMYGGQDLPADGSLPQLTWEGAKNVAHVILVAPPNEGSVTAFENLVNGKEFGTLLEGYPPALLGTFPSAYQLMPRARHARVEQAGDAAFAGIFEPGEWRRQHWGLADPDQIELLRILMPDAPGDGERVRRALAHQAKLLRRAEQFHRALDRPAPTPSDLDLFLVIGGGYATPARAVIDEDGTVRVDGVAEGDGVVLRASALRRGDQDHVAARADYRSVLLLPEEHVEILGSKVFGDNLLYWLLEGRRPMQVALAEPAQRGDLAATLLRRSPPGQIVRHFAGRD